MKKFDVIVLGAGLAGLTCAYELAKKGKKVVILEKNHRVGGLTRTFKDDGFLFDIGPHRWFTKNNEVDRWFKKLMKGRLVKVKRLTRIYFDKKFFHYPMRFENISRLGFLTAFQAFVDYVLVRSKNLVKKPKIITMEDVYVDQFGWTLYRKFFQRYSEKLWGRPCSKLSGDWVVQRSRRMSLLTVVKDLLIHSKGKVVSLTDSFFFPKLGIGEVSEKLEKEIKNQNGRIILGAEVVGINHRRHRIVSVTIKKDDKLQVITGNEFVSSVPLTGLVKMMKPGLSAGLNRAAKKLSYRSEVFVTLLVKGNKFFSDNWLYVHPPQIPFMRFVETNNFSAAMSPKGKNSLVFEIPCDEGDEIWNQKDEALIKMVIDSFVDEFGVVLKKDVLKGVVVRYAKAYPIYDLGYQKHLKMIKNGLASFLNLQIIGRYGTFHYNNMDHSVLTGIFAARNIMGGCHDINEVNTEKEYLEEKKVK